MKRTTLNLQQGSDAWLSARANSDGTASEAPAMQGVSKYQKRDELLLQRKTGLAKNVDSATQAIFNKGHAAEASARKIAEEIIGEELSPVTYMVEVDGLNLLASLDGVDFGSTVIWEHKLWNEKLAQQVKDENLDAHYTIQLDQELLASGAEKCLFMVSDGTRDKCVYMWYETTDAKATALVNGWKQFKKDLETFVPPVQVEKVEAETVETLPVPSVVVSGSITKSNLAEITPLFDNYLSSINTSLSTDEDFANAEANAKNCRETAKRIKSLRENIIAQMADVNAVDSALNNYEEAFNKVGLQLEKAVKEQKEMLKTNAVMKARQDYFAHVQSLEAEITPIRITAQAPDFAGAIKGIKTVESMQSRLNDALAAGKIEADAIARDIRVKLSWYKEFAMGYEMLFADLNQIIEKPMDDFQLLVRSRIDAKEKDDEAKYQKMKADAEAQAEADARAKLEREARENDQRAKAQVAEVSPSPTVSETVSSSPVKEVKNPTKPSAHEMVLVMMDRYHVDFGTAREWLNSANFAELKVAA